MKHMLWLTMVAVLTAPWSLVAQGRIDPTPGSVVQLTAPFAFRVTADIDLGRRELKVGDRSRDVELNRYLIKAGINPLRWCYVYAGAGWSHIKLEDENADGDVAFQAGVRVRLVEQILASSTITGVQQSMDLTVEAAYTRLAASLDGDDVEWGETSVMPLIAYVVTDPDMPVRHHFKPRASGLELGIRYADGDGHLGSTSMRPRKTLAGVVGGKFLLPNQWSVSARAMIYGSHDALYQLRMGRYF